MGNCNCCEVVNGCFPPDVYFSSFGWTLSPTLYDESVRGDIPIGAKEMKWLRYNYETQNDANHSVDRTCSLGGNWSQKYGVTKSGVYYYEEYDKDDDYILKKYIGGTETDLEKWRSDACDDPPILDLTIDTNWAGTWQFNPIGGYAELKYTGTDINGDPVSGSLGTHGFPFLYRADIAETFSLDFSPTKINQTRNWTWNVSEEGRSATGYMNANLSFENLSPLIVEIDPPEGVKFLQVKYKASLVPFEDDPEGEEVELDSGEWIFKANDEPEKLVFNPSTFGSLKLEMMYRCSRNAPFKRLIAEQ